MKELGVDLTDVKPQKLATERATTASLLVTMGCGETCPVAPGLKREDWPLEDPSLDRLPGGRPRGFRVPLEACQGRLRRSTWK